MALSQIFKFFHIANLVGKKEKLDTVLSFACQYTRVAGFPFESFRNVIFDIITRNEKSRITRAEQPPIAKRWLMLKDLEYVNKTSINTR